MDSITLTDHLGDTLEAAASESYLDLTVDESGETACVMFKRDSEAGEVRALRDYLNEWLGEQGKPLRPASSLSYNEGALRLALLHGKSVTFSYAKGDGSFIETRRFEPQEVKTSGDNVVVVGYDPDRNDYRAFRLDRIKGDVRVS